MTSEKEAIWRITLSASSEQIGRCSAVMRELRPQIKPIDFAARADLENALEAARQLRTSLQRPPITTNERLCQRCSLAPVCLPEEVRQSADAGHEAGVHERRDLALDVIQRALANHGYSRARAADALGISRVTLYKKMKKYGLMTIPLHPAQSSR